MNSTENLVWAVSVCFFLSAGSLTFYPDLNGDGRIGFYEFASFAENRLLGNETVPARSCARLLARRFFDPENVPYRGRYF